MISRDNQKNEAKNGVAERAVESSMNDCHAGSEGEAGHAAKQQLRHDKDLNRAMPETDGSAEKPEQTKGD